MPSRGDHDARRLAVSQAVWRVLARVGFSGLTMRAIALELGASTGLVTHYYSNKQELVRMAVELAEEKGRSRSRHEFDRPGLDGLRAGLLDVLPLTDEMAAMNRVWVSFWGEALSDQSLGDFEIKRYERWRGRLRPHVVAAIEGGELPPGTVVDDVVTMSAAFAHGVVVQALFDPDRFPPEHQRALVDQFVERLRGDQAGKLDP
ncbi:MAG TPA: TetR/AcrR family transcriptional regulator [Myxococcota bacterium]|nr:TetR/AcrR family transcriptional regulator [Myxococcota bacterium]